MTIREPGNLNTRRGAAWVDPRREWADDGFRILEVWRSAKDSAWFADRVLAPVVARLLGYLPSGPREVLLVQRLWLGQPVTGEHAS